MFNSTKNILALKSKTSYPVIIFGSTYISKLILNKEDMICMEL